MKSKIIYLIVSTEDDVQLVKGGIGTYLGLLICCYKGLEIEMIEFIEKQKNTLFFCLPTNAC